MSDIFDQNFHQEDDECFCNDCMGFSWEPKSWFDTDKSAPQSATICPSCDYYLVTEDTGLCNFCEPKMQESAAVVVASLEVLLAKHAAFQNWCEANEPRAA